MKLPILRPQHIAFLLSLTLALVVNQVAAQLPPPGRQQLQTRIDAAAVALGRDPQFKKTSLNFRQAMMEFVIGNILFAMLHELAHAAVDEMGLPVLGKEEDAADSFAVVRLIKLGSVFSHRVLVEAAKGWFLSVRRDKREGDEVDHRDTHALDEQRAHQIVCLLVGADPDQFKDLADETKLPKHRQKSCARDYSKASLSWELVLRPHLRSPNQPERKIDAVYGEGKGHSLERVAQMLRSIKLLETLAERWSNSYAWPESLTLEARTCGFPNAAWVQAARKLTLCYELVADFVDLYRTHDAALTTNRKRDRANSVTSRSLTSGKVPRPPGG